MTCDDSSALLDPAQEVHGRVRPTRGGTMRVVASSKIRRPMRLPDLAPSRPKAAAAASARSRFSQRGGAEVEAGGAVDDEPGLELAVGDGVAHVRVVGAGGEVPVDAADVVAGLVQAAVAGLGAGAGDETLVVAVEQAVELAA